MNKAQGGKCWNCGKPGIPYTASQWQCPECEVTWFPIYISPGKLNSKIVFYGSVIDAVDFTEPGAPSCP